MLQEEAMHIKEQLNNTDFENFLAYSGWLKSETFCMDYLKLALLEKLMTYLK